MYIFKKIANYENQYDLSTITFRVESDVTLSQLLEEFEYFLKACGFSFDGTLDIINEEKE